jgi:hypothetical protein
LPEVQKQLVVDVELYAEAEGFAVFLELLLKQFQIEFAAFRKC